MRKSIYASIIIILLISLLGVMAIAGNKTKDYNKSSETITIRDINGVVEAEYKLLNNSCDKDFRFCQAIIETDFKKSGKLLDNINFFKVVSDELVSGKVRWYKIYYYTLGDKIDVDEWGYICLDDKGKETKNNSISNCTYEITGSHKIDAPEWTRYSNQEFNGKKQIWKIEVEKRPNWIIDWVADVFDGVYLSEWAIWGNISLGDEAEVLMTSPENNSETNSFTNDFTCFTNITNGATVTNISHINNATGTFDIRKTTSYSSFIYKSLVSYWGMSDNSSDTNVIDELNINNGTISGANSDDMATVGKNGNGLYFNGTIAVDINSVFAGFPEDNFSINVWTNRGNIGGDLYIFSEWAPSDNRHIYFYFNSGAFYFEEWSSGAKSSVSNSLGDLGWDMVTITNNATNLVGYLNGVKVKSNSSINMDFTGYTTTYIGANQNRDAEFIGILDELQIYNKSLTPEEVAELYNESNPYTITIGGGSSVAETFSDTIEGDVLSTCYACDSDGVCAYSEGNYTLYINKTAPIIQVNSPNSSSIITTDGEGLLVNFSSLDANIDSCWIEYNGTNTSVSNCVSGVSNQTNITSEFDVNTLTIYVNDTVGNINYTTLSVPFDYPNFTINSPSSTTTSADITVNVTIQSVAELQNCSYNITKGASTEKVTEWVNCSNFIDTYTLSGEGDYVINLFANQSGSIYNTTSYSFSYATTTPPVDGGGGGSSATVTGEKGWSMEAGDGISRFDSYMSKGQTRSFVLKFENLGDSGRTITLSCEDVEGDICKYVEFSEKTFELALLKDQKQSIEYKINLPKDVENGDYKLNIRAVDDLQKEGAVTMFLGVGTLGLIPALLNRILLASTTFGLPYFLIFFPSLILLFIFSSKLIKKDTPFKPVWVILSALSVSITLVYLL